MTMKMNFVATSVIASIISLILATSMIPDLYEASRTLAFVPANRNFDSDHPADGSFAGIACEEDFYGCLGVTMSNFVAEVFQEIATMQSPSSSGLDPMYVKHAMQNLELSFAMKNCPVMLVRIRHSNSNLVEQIATCCVSTASRLAREANKRRKAVSSLQFRELVNKQRSVVDKIRNEAGNGKLADGIAKKLVENQGLLDSLQRQLDWVENSNENGIFVSEVVSDRLRSHYVGKAWFCELWPR